MNEPETETFYFVVRHDFEGEDMNDISIMVFEVDFLVVESGRDLMHGSIVFVGATGTPALHWIRLLT